MDNWVLRKNGYRPEEIVTDGNRFLCANGYMGLRGTAEEAGRDLFPAVTLAGVYDRRGDLWREPVNAPNALFAQVFFNGRALHAAEAREHRVKISYRHGIFSRETDFGPVRLQSGRFGSMAAPHLLADRLRLTAQADGELCIRTGISADIWDINGPHLTNFSFRQGEAALCRAVTGEKGITVAAAQAVQADSDFAESFEQGPQGIFRVLRCFVRAGEEKTLSLFAAVYTSLDGDAPGKAAEAACLAAKAAGFDQCLQAHRDAWESIWAQSEVTLEGNDEAARAMHASQYHLNSVAPRHAGDMSIPARGLSGQTYKGAVFWDSEMFFFPMFVYTQPDIARSLLRYRIKTLPGALKKAAEYGYRGAFYAWESQEGGEEGCTNFNVVDVFTHRPVRTYFRDRQIHISGDIAYALRSYYDLTGDRTLPRSTRRTGRTIFFSSMVSRRSRRRIMSVARKPFRSAS